MRNTLIVAVVILLLIAGGRAYQEYPDQCTKIGTDFLAIFDPSLRTSVTSGQTNSSQDEGPEPGATPIKLWSPPTVMPSQPGWTWTTSDSNTYQNVVVTKVEADTATITSSAGEATIPISSLTSDIQERLNYDQDAAASADHSPFMGLASVKDAQALAMQLHRPLAWIASLPNSFLSGEPDVKELTEMAIHHLKPQAIIILVQDGVEMSKMPAPVERRLLTSDDGVSTETRFYPPNVVISSPDATRTFGRISHDKLAAGREAALDAVLSTVAIKWPADKVSTPATSPASAPTIVSAPK